MLLNIWGSWPAQRPGTLSVFKSAFLDEEEALGSAEPLGLEAERRHSALWRPHSSLLSATPPPKCPLSFVLQRDAAVFFQEC